MELNLKENIDITNLTSFRTKAKTKYLFEINNYEDIYLLNELWRFCEDNKLGIYFIWKWTNTLFAFDHYDGVIVKNNLKWWNYDEKTKILEAYSNEPISNIASVLKKEYWNEIWSRFIWLPWGIWGAVFWNAGCFWLETENNFLEAEVYNIETWQVEVFNKLDTNFAYRSSYFKENSWKYFIIKVLFDLSEVIEKYHSDVNAIVYRQKEHPKGLSCGSFFRNPNRENSAGFLIEAVWLKWYKIWWAYFSEIHANFLMSDGTATYQDILDLINLAIKKVKEEKKMDLIPEVRIINNNGKN